MNKTLIYTALLAAVCSIQACYYDNEEELYGAGPTVTEARWTADIQPIVNASCAVAGCHVAGNGIPELTTYSLVKTIVDDSVFCQRVLVDQDMPPSQPLTAEDLAKVEAWLDAGALED